MDRIKKLGAFYLGREYDLKERICSEKEIMYDARRKDLADWDQSPERVRAMKDGTTERIPAFNTEDK